MKKLLLVPLMLMASQAYADYYYGMPPQTPYGMQNYYAESQPSYTPPSQMQIPSSTYKSPGQYNPTPNQPNQQNLPNQQNTQTQTQQGQTNTMPSSSSYTTPSYSNSQHPYGAPGRPAGTYQQQQQTPGGSQQRVFPAHPYGPPGRSMLSDAAPSYNRNNASTASVQTEPKTNAEIIDKEEKSSDDKAETKSEPNASMKEEGRDHHKTEKDRLLNQKIRDSINAGYGDSFPSIVLVTSDGFVVIEGFVTSIEAHDKLERNVSKIEGVKGVINNTTVKVH